ncbi:hypothetical protein PR202_gb05811 [Eleusine coracana subsp. coracana]|uniref:Uncharacterized protein n=1 Tax=Eleusine coracana subsp. coracana TaxID=191504 RepID=A0AAV5E7B7_ELECO|nr:hypothetical protein PR202_gb05811 [Eleusine coracana subsp. coracana]
MPLLDKGAMKCQVLESDAVGLDARVEGSVFKPTELKNNIKVCDVEMEAYGNYKGHGLPLAFLISKSTGKPIKGYPVAVEVLEDSCPAPTTEVNGSAISCFDCLMESGISVPRQARSLRKPSGSRKISEHDLGKSWGLDARSFSSYSNSPRKNLTERSNRKAVVAEGFQPPTQSTSKPASSPRQMQSLSYFPDSRGECANSGPLGVKGSPWPSLSLRVDAMEDSECNADEFHSDSSDNEYQSDSSTDEYHSGSSADEDYVRPITYIAGSQGSPPVATSSRSINGCALYLCSASTLCAPVRLV